ncbi:MAG: hypothetical protein Q9210_003601 [Variospora velana]
MACRPTLQSDGTANVGLYNQRLAFQCLQTYIHLFGGDPNRVTVFGGSILHQITAFGGLAGKALFQQAVSQSLGFQNLPSNFQQETTVITFLSLLKVSTLQEARQLPSSTLIEANRRQVGASPYGLFTYNPVVDCLIAPSIPRKLLLQGSYDHDLKLMLGQNYNEGLAFTSPFVTTVVGYIDDVLYPPPSNGTLYQDDIGRNALSISESVFIYNTLYLDRAFGNQTYAYEFSVPPFLHGQDIPYTFFNGPNTAVLSDATAPALQVYITSFAENGTPSGSGIPSFPLYGNDSTILNLNATSITAMIDRAANEQCLWWQKALYYG